MGGGRTRAGARVKRYLGRAAPAVILGDNGFSLPKSQRNPANIFALALWDFADNLIHFQKMIENKTLPVFIVYLGTRNPRAGYCFYFEIKRGVKAG